jgi:hypothetical protein
MNETEERDLLSQLEIDPYQSEGRKLVGLRFQSLQNRPSADDVGSWAYGKAYARDLCIFAQQALLYWSPERVEREALRRAADNAEPSVIAREVQVFTLRHQLLVNVLAETLPYVPPAKQMENAYIREMQFYLAQFESVLLALERRAAAAEARATDYRLRYDLGQVRAAVENSRVASAVAGAIREALATSEEGHLQRIDAALATRLGPLLDMQTRTLHDVQFMADYIGQELVNKTLPSEKVRKVLSELATATTVEALKSLLLLLVSRF